MSEFANGSSHPLFVFTDLGLSHSPKVVDLMRARESDAELLSI